MLEFRLLGSVEAIRDGESLPLGGRRQRALLALLLHERGRPVAFDRLADDLWQGKPPAGAATTLRSYVSRLRATLGGEAPLRAHPTGYVLDVQPDRVDAHRFERLVGEGEEALGLRRRRHAREQLHAALELWRGPPFADLADDGTLRLEAERLGQLRLLALEWRIEADLELGGHAELVDELEALVREHPYRERFWQQLMLALYRAGRQADSLAAYRRARTILVEELGLEPSEELRRLEQAVLRQEAPATVLPSRPSIVPVPVTSLVGREVELAELERLLAHNRLVTLTGVGGVGKTRLALEAAQRVLHDYADGVVFVDFSPLAASELVARHVAAELDVAEQPGSPVEEQLAARLRDRDVLLVLDNCEHVGDACAELAATLLASCPPVRLLATSRAVLGVPGEIDYPVPPLAVPPTSAGADDLRSSEAVRLFLARSLEVRPRLDEEAALASAAEICRKLDGLPLAIELAAARAKTLSPDEIEARLADRFRFLVSWRRLTTARHRTLREAMDWSYELLSENEQSLLSRVSVFAGGFTLNAVARVCLDGDDDRALDLVGRLVDASLVVAEDRDGTTRLVLLETVRQYAAERLEASGERDAARRRHASWCLELVEEAEAQLTGERQTYWLALLDTERDNLREALGYLTAAGEAESRLRLAIAISRFWYIRGHLTEGRRWLELALHDYVEGDPSLQRRALTAAASLALLQGDYGTATAFGEDALVAARAQADPLYVANALSNLGAIVLATGDHTRARGLLDEAVGLAREVGDQRILALALNNRGDLALTLGEYERAGPLFEESLSLLRARGDTANLARSLFNVGAVALKLGRLPEAGARFRESVGFAQEAGDLEDLAWCLEGLAGLAAAEGRGEHAASLLGAAEALLQRMGADFKPFERQLHTTTRAEAIRLCGEARFEEQARAGATLSPDDAVAAGLAEPTRI